MIEGAGGPQFHWSRCGWSTSRHGSCAGVDVAADGEISPVFTSVSVFPAATVIVPLSVSVIPTVCSTVPS
jgi:hypothetical protein